MCSRTSSASLDFGWASSTFSMRRRFHGHGSGPFDRGWAGTSLIATSHVPSDVSFRGAFCAAVHLAAVVGLRDKWFTCGIDLRRFMSKEPAMSMNGFTCEGAAVGRKRLPIVVCWIHQTLRANCIPTQQPAGPSSGLLFCLQFRIDWKSKRCWCVTFRFVANHYCKLIQARAQVGA